MAKKELKNEVDQIDIKKIEEEIKNNIRNDLYDEITNKIDTEAKKVLEKMEKRFIKYKNSSIRKRNFIIFILLIIIAFETYVILNNEYFIFNNKDQKEQEKVTETVKSNDDEIIKQEDIKDEKWYIDNYSYLMDNIKTNLIEDKYYLYKADYIETSIKNSVRLNMAYQLLDESKISNQDGIIKIQVKDLENSYKKIFGNLNNYKNENFSNGCIQFIYNKDLNMFLAIDTSCETDSKEVIEQINTIYEENNDIVIETMIAIYDSENKTLLNISGEKIIDNYNNNLTDYEAKLEKRIYVFEKNNDEYYLKEIKSKKN